MKKIFYVIPIILITFAACVNDGVNEPVSPDPVIESIALNYSQSNKSLFISAKVTDPQGWETIDSVVFHLYRMDSTDTNITNLFMTGLLLDDGPPLDIIKRDNVYSYLIDSNVLSNNEGFLIAHRKFTRFSCPIVLRKGIHWFSKCGLPTPREHLISVR